jgi:hypothetical protein
MITGFLTFLFLYGLVAIFERIRDDLEAFSIAAAVLIFNLLLGVGYEILRGAA